jgi:hypothetical protein
MADWACCIRLTAFSGVRPEPMMMGSLVELATDSSSARSGSEPVWVQVIMMPSLWKYSAALAHSAMSKSAVRAWELCFFLMSVSIWTCSAPMNLR